MAISSEHILGTKTGQGKKQLLIALAGIHGNEKAGLHAIEKVFSVLHNTTKKFNGTFLGLAGNLIALKENKRYINADLNRIWTKEDFELAKSLKDKSKHQDHWQLKSLLKTIEYYLADGYEEVAIIDLHTTSANGGVFIACPNDETHIKMIKRLHVPVILNLDKDLRGTAMQYFWDREVIAFAFEGGNHYSPDSIDKMESAIWLCLEYMGCIDRHEYDNVEYHDLRLIHSTEDLPHFCNVIYHHRIDEGDNFKMEPGFVNFQKVKKGTVLATDKNGEILCLEDCFVLMPLYQEQGSDGFFLIKQR